MKTLYVFQLLSPAMPKLSKAGSDCDLCGRPQESIVLKNKRLTFPCMNVSLNDKLKWTIFCVVSQCVGAAVAQWLRCCATNRKVAGSIPDGVTGIFH